MKRVIERLLAPLAALAGAVLVACLGWVFLKNTSGTSAKDSFGRPVLHLSYDLPLSVELPFITRKPVPTEVCIIYMTDSDGHKLDQSSGIWSRKVHAQLVRRLTAEGARAVFFDLVFDSDSPEPGADDELAAAMKENGRVFLGGHLEIVSTPFGQEEKIFAPIAKFKKASAGWGLLAFRPIDADYAIRYLYCGTEKIPIAAWRMADKLGARLPADAEARQQPRWLNYYGPVDCLPHTPYFQAMQPDGLPPGFFKDKIVFVGGRSSVGYLGLGKDDFRHPYTRWNRQHVPGVEIQATSFLNLFRGDWLERVDTRQEEWFILGIGALLVLVLSQFRPEAAALIALVTVLAITAFAFWLVQHHQRWSDWCVPVMIQTPVALVWAIGSRYLLVDRRRGMLRDAFAHYLSPQIAERIADSRFELRPGGTVMEASIVFTDLEGFTGLSERLDDPARLAEVLTQYFTLTTGHVLENDGTIVKYIGDAVFAVWGAPLPDPSHAAKAALAACRMHGAAQVEVEGFRLRTRIGLHTGPVLSGNLGSAQRFDYTCIGDAVNFASRLEGINKYLGTHILLSDATRQRVDGQFLTRRLGRFCVVGRKADTGIHELLGEAGKVPMPPWLEEFEEALTRFAARDFDAAQRRFESIIAQRGGSDGPSTFYLQEIAALRATPPPDDWEGVVKLLAK